MSEEEAPTVEYKDGDIVWVKLGPSWWPGEVKDFESLPLDVGSFKKRPLVVVKFFNEDLYEYVRSWSHIFPYNCDNKKQFIRKGLAAYRSKAPHMEKFPQDVSTAEIKIGGNPNILTDPEFTRKQFNPSDLFRSPSPIGKRHKDKNKSRISKSKDTAHITHRRFLGNDALDDYRAYICIQYPGKDRTPGDPDDEEVIRINKELEQEYKCHSCTFTTKRLEVMIMHRKSHIQGVYISSTPRKYKSLAAKKPKKDRYREEGSRDKKKKVQSPKKDVKEQKSNVEGMYGEASKKKKKMVEKGEKSQEKGGASKETDEYDDKFKKVKSIDPEEITEEILAEWDDGDDEEELSLSFVTNSDTMNESSIKENSTKGNSSLGTDVIEAEDVDKANEVEIENKDLEKVVDEKRGEEKKNEQEIHIERGEKKIDSKEQNDKAMTLNDIVKQIDKDIKSCFDFDEEEEEEPLMSSTPIGRKIPRVIPERRKTLNESPPPTNELEEERLLKEPEALKTDGPQIDNLDTFKELMEITKVPDLSDIQNTLKCEQNFHKLETIKFPDKPVEDLSSPLEKAAKPSLSEKIYSKVDKETVSEELIELPPQHAVEDLNVPRERIVEVMSPLEIAVEPSSAKEPINATSLREIEAVTNVDSTVVKETDDIPFSREKNDTEVATKLTNPKKRFVKTFEDFELKRKEEQAEQEKSAAEEAASEALELKVDGEHRNIADEQTVERLLKRKSKVKLSEPLAVRHDLSSSKTCVGQSSAPEEPSASMKDVITSLANQTESNTELEAQVQLANLKTKIMSKIIDESRISTESRSKIMSLMGTSEKKVELEGRQTRSKKTLGMHKTQRSKILEDYRNDQNKAQSSTTENVSEVMAEKSEGIVPDKTISPRKNKWLRRGSKEKAPTNIPEIIEKEVLQKKEEMVDELVSPERGRAEGCGKHNKSISPMISQIFETGAEDKPQVSDNIEIDMLGKKESLPEEIVPPKKNKWSRRKSSDKDLCGLPKDSEQKDRVVASEAVPPKKSRWSRIVSEETQPETVTVVDKDAFGDNEMMIEDSSKTDHLKSDSSTTEDIINEAVFPKKNKWSKRKSPEKSHPSTTKNIVEDELDIPSKVINVMSPKKNLSDTVDVEKDVTARKGEIVLDETDPLKKNRWTRRGTPQKTKPGRTDSTEKDLIDVNYYGIAEEAVPSKKNKSRREHQDQALSGTSKDDEIEVTKETDEILLEKSTPAKRKLSRRGGSHEIDVQNKIGDSANVIEEVVSSKKRRCSRRVSLNKPQSSMIKDDPKKAAQCEKVVVEEASSLKKDDRPIIEDIEKPHSVVTVDIGKDVLNIDEELVKETGFLKKGKWSKSESEASAKDSETDVFRGNKRAVTETVPPKKSKWTRKGGRDELESNTSKKVEVTPPEDSEKIVNIDVVPPKKTKWCRKGTQGEAELISPVNIETDDIEEKKETTQEIFPPTKSSWSKKPSKDKAQSSTEESLPECNKKIEEVVPPKKSRWSTKCNQDKSENTVPKDKQEKEAFEKKEEAKTDIASTHDNSWADTEKNVTEKPEHIFKSCSSTKRTNWSRRGSHPKKDRKLIEKNITETIPGVAVVKEDRGNLITQTKSEEHQESIEDKTDTTNETFTTKTTGEIFSLTEIMTETSIHESSKPLSISLDNDNTDSIFSAQSFLSSSMDYLSPIGTASPSLPENAICLPPKKSKKRQQSSSDDWNSLKNIDSVTEQLLIENKQETVTTESAFVCRKESKSILTTEYIVKEPDSMKELVEQKGIPVEVKSSTDESIEQDNKAYVADELNPIVEEPLENIEEKLGEKHEEIVEGGIENITVADAKDSEVVIEEVSEVQEEQVIVEEPIEESTTNDTSTAEPHEDVSNITVVESKGEEVVIEEIGEKEPVTIISTDTDIIPQVIEEQTGDEARKEDLIEKEEEVDNITIVDNKNEEIIIDNVHENDEIIVTETVENETTLTKDEVNEPAENITIIENKNEEIVVEEVHEADKVAQDVCEVDLRTDSTQETPQEKATDVTMEVPLPSDQPGQVIDDVSQLIQDMPTGDKLSSNATPAIQSMLETSIPEPTLEEHNNEVEIQCASSSEEDNIKFSIQTNLSFSSQEEISAIALATLAEIKSDFENSDSNLSVEPSLSKHEDEANGGSSASVFQSSKDITDSGSAVSLGAELCKPKTPMDTARNMSLEQLLQEPVVRTNIENSPSKTSVAAVVTSLASSAPVQPNDNNSTCTSNVNLNLAAKFSSDKPEDIINSASNSSSTAMAAANKDGGDIGLEKRSQVQEMVPIEGNLTVVSEKDLADGQVEITPEQVISTKKPAMLSTFSMDFSDSTNDSCSTNESKFSDFDSKGTEFTSSAMTKELKPKGNAKKPNTYGRLELLDILEGNSDMEKKVKPKQPIESDMCDFEDHIPSQIVCAKMLSSDMFKEKDAPKSSVAVTTHKLLERLTEGKNKQSPKTHSAVESTTRPTIAPKTFRGGKGKVSAIAHKPVPLSEQTTKLTDGKPGKAKQLDDIEDVEAFVIHKDPKKIRLEEIESAALPEKLPKVCKSRIAGKAKILQQTIITPAGEVIQPNVSAPAPPSTDDNIFDINSMPIVLSDELLTPESIEKMPIVIGTEGTSAKAVVQDKVVVTNAGSSRPILKKIITKVATTTSPVAVSKPPPATATPTKVTPKSRILQSTGAKIVKQVAPAIPGMPRPGKYIIVPQSATVPPIAKYIGKKVPLKKVTTTVPTSPSVEPTGNKIMIVTNQQGQQQRLLLTPAQQKMLGCQTPGTKVTKTIVKGNVLQKSMLAVKGSAEPSTSGVAKTQQPVTGQKVILATSTAPGLVTPPTQQLVSQSTLARQFKGGKKVQQSISQKVVPTSASSKPQKTILIKTAHGQTVKKIQGTDEELEKQVAEQLEAIRASSALKFGPQPRVKTPDTKIVQQKPVRRSTTKKQDVKQRVLPCMTNEMNVAVKTETIPPLTPARRPETAPAKPAAVSEPKTTRPLNQLVIQDALGNQTTITEGQILALPSETVDGQPQSYMLVTLDESGNLTPLNNEALMSLDPNLGVGGDLSNMVLQIDQSAAQTAGTDQRLPLAQQAIVKTQPSQVQHKIAVAPSQAQSVVPEPVVTTEVATTVVEQTHPVTESVPKVVDVQPITTMTNDPPGQQLIVTGDPIATQKFLESLTEGTTDLANILANADGNSILIQADGQQILINTNSENQMLLSVNNDNLAVSENTEGGGNPVFATQPNKNQDILAAALADTDVFQSEQQSQGKIASQLSPNNALYPINVGNVLETSLTLSSPIMTPLEVPSTNNKKIPDDEADILTQVPKNVDLPITITDPNISQTVANQQVASLIANELQTNLELTLPISESSIVTATNEMTSPSYVYSLPALDDSVDISSHKPFNSSMPLLDVDESTQVQKIDTEEGNTEKKREVKKETEDTDSCDSKKQEDSMNSDGSFLEEEGRFTLGGEMCSSLSEPPPEMFEIPEVNTSYGRRLGNNMSSLQSPHDNISKDGDTTDMSHQDSSNDDSCEIPLQPRIIAKSSDLNSHFGDLERNS